MILIALVAQAVVNKINNHKRKSGKFLAAFVLNSFDHLENGAEQHSAASQYRALALADDF